MFNNDQKTHYKMYKAGKRWMFGAITVTMFTAGIAGGTLLSNGKSVHADTNVSTTQNLADPSTTSASSDTQKSDSNVQASETKATTTPSQNEDAKAAPTNNDDQKSATTQVETTSDQNKSDANTQQTDSDKTTQTTNASEKQADNQSKSTDKQVEQNKQTTDNLDSKTDDNSVAQVKNTNPDESQVQTDKSDKQASSEQKNDNQSKNIDSKIAPENDTQKATENDTQKATENVNQSQVQLNADDVQANQTFGINMQDPDYKSAGVTWTDPDEQHYTYGWISVNDRQSSVSHIVYSTDRNGDGTVYLYELDSNNQVLNKIILNQSKQQVNSSNINNVTYYRDDNNVYFNTTPRSNLIFKQTWTYDDSNSDGSNPSVYGISLFTPEIVTQKVVWTNKDNGQIMATHDYQGMAGQHYNVTGIPPEISSTTYYISTRPSNAEGSVSNFGVPGTKWTKHYADGYSMTYTETDNHGGMDVSLYNSQGSQYGKTYHIDADYQYSGDTKYSWNPGNGSIYILYPIYVPQSRDIEFQVGTLGKLIPVDKDGNTIDNGSHDEPYKIDPNDPTKAQQPTIPDIPGYAPVDPNDPSKKLKPGDPSPVPVTDPGKDTDIPYVKDAQSATVTYVDDAIGATIPGSPVTELSGSYNQPIDKSSIDSEIAALKAKGYKYVSSDVPDKFSDQNNQAYTVHFTHNTSQVTDNSGKGSLKVTYVYENGKQAAPDASKDVTFHRTGTKDEVTGNVEWNAWLPDSNTNVTIDSPTISGYYPNQSVVSDDIVEGKNDTAKVVYIADAEKATVNYVDQDNNNAVLHSDALDGKFGEKSGYSTKGEITALENAGYELVSDGYPVDGYTFTTDDPTFTVVVKHKTKTVTPDNPGTPGQPVDPDNPTGPKYPDGTSEQDVVKDITRTIHYQYADGTEASKDVTEQVKYTRDVTFDEVTGKIISSTDWKSDNPDYASVTSPVIPGFVADQPVVGKATTKSTDSNSEVTVHYNAAAEKATVNYVDQDNNNAVLHSDALDGKFGERSGYATKDEITALENAGYELVSDGYPVDGYTFTTDDPTFTVVVKHKTKTVTPDNPGTPGQPVDPDNPTGPKYPDGTSEQDVVKDITRTIHYQYADGTEASKDVTEQVKYTRDVTFDEVTGKIISSTDWKSDNPDYASVTSPVIPGFVADQPVVGKATTKSTDSNSEVTVHYNAAAEKATVNYVDQDNNNAVLHSDALDGKFGEKSGYSTKGEITALENAGYELVSDGYPVDGYTFTTDDPTFTVVVKHKTKTVTPDNPGTPGQPVDPDNPTGPKYPDGTSEQDVVKDITRTIHYQYADGTEASKDVTEQVKYTRDVTFDEVTGKIISSTDWKSDNPDYASVTSPVIPGFVADQPVVGKATTKSTDSNSEVTVHYNAAAEKATVNYLDQDNNNAVLHSDALDGKFGERSGYATKDEITALENAGYELVSDGYPVDGYTFTTDDPTFTVVVKHKTKTVTPDNPGTPGQPVDPDNPTGPKYPDGTSEQDVVKDITRTIHYQYADGTEASKDVTEQVKYTRDVTFDEVTGKIISSTDWKSDNPDYASVTSPVIPGFVADQPVVGKATTKSTDSNSEVTVHYNAAAEKATVNYVDQDNNNAVLHSDALDGKFGERSGYATKDEITALENAGYELVSDGYPVDGYTFTTDDPTFTVVVKHKTKTVTPDNPGTPGQPVDPDNPTGPKYPDGTNKDNLTKNVTRTIHYVDDQGNTVSADVDQATSFGREATFDEVTGKLSYTAWTPSDATFNEVNSPVITGYYTDTAKVSAEQVNADTANGEVTVVYHKLGNLIPEVPGGTPVPYPNDPTDSTKPGQPITPNYPGYTPLDPDGKPIVPGTPYPINPNEPGKDTPVPYVADAEQAHVNYVDQDNNDSIIKSDNLDGKFGEKSGYTTKDEIAALENQGYELVTDGYPADYTFTTEDPTFTVVLKHKTSSVTPDNPGTPGQPVDPNNPDGPKYPDGTSDQDLAKEVTRTIHYVDDQGNTISPDVVETTKFGRDATFDEVTGKVISYGNWTPINDTFGAVNSPVINGYYTDTPFVSAKTINSDATNSEVTVLYHALGHLVPDVPGSTPVIYPNNPTNPSEAGNPIIPDIPGYTPVDNNGNKLTPGTPYPIDHNDLGKDTPLHYVKNEVPTTPVTPSTPEKPTTPAEPSTPVQPAAPATPEKPAAQPAQKPEVPAKAELPQTGQDATASLMSIIGTILLAILGFFGLDGFRKKNDEK